MSSVRLHRAAKLRNISFLVADFVRYEALMRPRKNATDCDRAMQQQLKIALEQAAEFASVSITVEDLQAVASMPEVARLGKGEIAAIAAALKLRTAILTDDQKARRTAKKIGVHLAQTTPHLLGWLIFEGDIGDGDFRTVLHEHESNVPPARGRLTRYFQDIYHEACRCRLMRENTNVG